jgi:hypothetical protein
VTRVIPPTPVRDTLHLHEHFRPQFAHLDNYVRWNVQPLCRLADGLGIRSFIQAVGFLLVGTQERE